MNQQSVENDALACALHAAFHGTPAPSAPGPWLRPWREQADRLRAAGWRIIPPTPPTACEHGVFVPHWVGADGDTPEYICPIPSGEDQS